VHLLDLVALYITPQQASVAVGYINRAGLHYDAAGKSRAFCPGRVAGDNEAIVRKSAEGDFFQ